MSKKIIIGGVAVVLGTAYAVYSALTGDYSGEHILGGFALVLGGGVLGRRGEKESKLAKDLAEE